LKGKVMTDELADFNWSDLYHKTFTDVQLMFSNFRGLASQYNAEGRRSFCVVLPEDIGPDMWHIKSRRSDDGIITQFTPVRIPSGFDFSKLTLDGRPLTDSDTDMSMLDLGKNLICTVEVVGRPWRIDADVQNGRPERSGVATYLVSLDAKTN
jgi:hypothetical protein